MKFPRLLVLFVLIAGLGKSAGAQPPKGSHLSSDENACAMCHGEADLWTEENQRRYISEESLAQDVHFLKGVNCHDCHGGDPSAFDPGDLHAKEDGFRELKDVWNACGQCHKDEAVALRKGVHAKAGERDERGRGTPLQCSKCHGQKAHGMRPVHNDQSPVYLDNQVRTCGGCHEEHLTTYQNTVHGKGLSESGLVVTAVCADCHGAHGVYFAADRRSTLNPTRVADTCGKCHRFIEDRLEKSVHGHGSGPGGTVDQPVPGDQRKRKPSCTDCHEGHLLLDPALPQFRLQLVNRCGNCHAKLSGEYSMSLHGELTELGYNAAANCSDCHGSHSIQPIVSAQSRVAAGENRLQTCRKCHTNAVVNFGDFNPHADHHDAAAHPVLHATYTWIENVVLLFFATFAVHAFLWFWRSLLRALQYGRDKTLITGQYAILRLVPLRRIVYLLLLVSFLGLTVTGMPLKYSNQQWARHLSQWMGGFDSSRIWHLFFAMLGLTACVVHVVWGIRCIIQMRARKISWKTIVFGPDSPVPVVRDVRDLFRMVFWFFGMGPKPGFERWTYWEKFDYWATYLVVFVVGVSGAVLWYPNLFCLVLPGSALNLAKVVHSELAILVAGYLFFTHSFNTHFRPEKFPVDLSVLTGLVSEAHLRKARPDYIKRLEASGTLETLRRPSPPKQLVRWLRVTAILILLAGLILLVGIFVAHLGK